ncbi:expressed protein [Cryptococcus deneoformans JEC21]|uniref:Expressed protein n=1 Tax=Cryptococcus deneoformans (strain JEC21 / ATCC MYA-565) TaxID=214684 RepID=A0A0S2M661_CRYD1|nr:expressed protein [Cryptococcus neoformans var. neoformans JEC21]ALO69797.1 expressed protein [Cryptococcus neoformans var. neoformans JEC21]
MPREPQTTERPPPPAPEHRAQRIGDLLEREYMPTRLEWKKQSYEKLFDALCYDATREDNYRTDMLQLFFLKYFWDMGYLKSHDMLMPFSQTDASKVINQLVPSKVRTTKGRFRISWCWSSLTCFFWQSRRHLKSALLVNQVRLPPVPEFPILR